MEKLLLRPAEVAETLGLGKSKTYGMISEGSLPSIRIGKSVRVPAASLRDWVQQQVSGAVDEDGTGDAGTGTIHRKSK